MTELEKWAKDRGIRLSRTPGVEQSAVPCPVCGDSGRVPGKRKDTTIRCPERRKAGHP